jgi:hypothetical protein
MKSKIATDRGQIHQQLALAARCADEAQERINRQRTRVHMLHEYGYNTKVAKAELTQLVRLQTQHKEDRDRLRGELAKIG